ncbi:MAG: outer membrane lipoprotein carrier protein LolA [Spirochaetales bacterium]|nr:outer membrane lipoprotein carrier protein LolA [Spirochaetales bacterium]
MIKKKYSMRWISLIFFVFICASLGAQDIFDYPVTSEQSAEVDSIFSELASHDIIKSSYRQIKHIPSINRDVISSGIFLFHKERGLAWIVKSPFPMNITINDSEIVQEAGGQRQILSFGDDPSFAQFSTTVQSVFRGEYDVIKKYYDMFYHKFPDHWTIALEPKDETLKSLIASFVLEGNTQIETFIINEAQGGITTYEFEDLQYPDSLTSEESDVLP